VLLVCGGLDNILDNDGPINDDDKCSLAEELGGPAVNCAPDALPLTLTENRLQTSPSLMECEGKWKKKQICGFVDCLRLLHRGSTFRALACKQM